ncbi:HlyC/CorC family transporter [Sphingorhabdus soli]|uniref:HlyC/CorC family transporter n=1 Tax=Flavisphingopyxis soli TaxID=2601267 RepID=A0A5C6UNR9_9SPHN|nr:hemolysin family protein [Sphingorhabdus soli]TXC74214.1 HlyC/CorC family transporter [Sphingorhabdus soli]
MADDVSLPASDAGDTDEGSGRIWRGLKALLFGDGEEQSLREQLEDVIDDHEHDDDARTASAKGPSTDLTPLERQMLRNMLHFGEETADDVAVPRADIIAIAATSSFGEIVAQFAEAGHSRLPVYQGSLDSIVGMLHVKDVFARLAEDSGDEDWSPLIRQPLYVPVSMGVLDLLAEMRSKRTHLAIVVDEYSGTEGLVTIEDLVEEIVGEIEDEHDDEPVEELVARDDGVWDADARVELDDLARTVSPRLAEVEGDVDTLGGLAFVLAGHVPKAGEILQHDSGWRLEILASDYRRVSRVRLHPPAAKVEA